MMKTMEAMTAEQVKENAVEILKKCLEEYPQIEVAVSMESDDDTIPVECVTVADYSVMGYRIPVQYLIEKVQKGEDIEKYLKAQMVLFPKEYESVKEAYDFFNRVENDFEMAQAYLMPFVFDAREDEDLLDNHPYRRIGDIAMEVHLLHEDENARTQMSVNYDLLQKWGISEEKLYEKMFARYQESAFLNGTKETVYIIEQDENSKRKPVNYLKTGNAKMVFGLETEFILGWKSSCDHGAALIFDPVIMKKAADSFDDDFYILPACRDSEILTPVAGRVSKEMVAELYDGMHQMDGELVGEVSALPMQPMMYQRATREVVVVPEE